MGQKITVKVTVDLPSKRIEKIEGVGDSILLSGILFQAAALIAVRPPEEPNRIIPATMIPNLKKV